MMQHKIKNKEVKKLNEVREVREIEKLIVKIW
jgi:hypothetical protein